MADATTPVGAPTVSETLIPVLDDPSAPGAVAAGEPALPVLDETKPDTLDAKLPKNATLQGDGTVKLTLLYPVTLRFKSGHTGAVREEAYPALVFNPLTGADQNAIMATSREKMMQVGAARSLRMFQAKFDMLWGMMDARDTRGCVEVTGYFLGVGPATGE